MTTNTNDLREASERFRQGDSYDWIVDPDTDAYLLANAYLAEHPADDDEPWDMEWLTSEHGFAKLEGYRCWILKRGEFEIRAFDDVSGWEIVATGIRYGQKFYTELILPRPENRRDVRQLLRSLGFKTRETT